jgi:hypothetical protein
MHVSPRGSLTIQTSQPLVLVKPNTLSDVQSIMTPGIRIPGRFPGMSLAKTAPDFHLTVHAGPITYAYYKATGAGVAPASASDGEIVLPAGLTVAAANMKAGSWGREDDVPVAPHP